MLLLPLFPFSAMCILMPESLMGLTQRMMTMRARTMFCSSGSTRFIEGVVEERVLPHVCSLNMYMCIAYSNINIRTQQQSKARTIIKYQKLPGRRYAKAFKFPLSKRSKQKVKIYNL